MLNALLVGKWHMHHCLQESSLSKHPNNKPSVFAQPHMTFLAAMTYPQIASQMSAAAAAMSVSHTAPQWLV